MFQPLELVNYNKLTTSYFLLRPLRSIRVYCTLDSWLSIKFWFNQKKRLNSDGTSLLV